MKEKSDIALTVTHELLDALRPLSKVELLTQIAAATALLLSRGVVMDDVLEALRAGEDAVGPSRRVPR